MLGWNSINYRISTHVKVLQTELVTLEFKVVVENNSVVRVVAGIVVAAATKEFLVLTFKTLIFTNKSKISTFYARIIDDL